MATNIGRVTQSIENGAPKQTNAVAKNAPNIQIRQHLANLGEQLVSHSNQNQQEIATLRQRVIVPLPQTAPLQAIQQVINIEEAEPVQEVIVYTWPLEGKHVRLVRLGDKLQSRVTYPNGNIINGLIALPAWLTAENAIIELMEKNPVVDDNNQVRFTKKPEIELLPEPQAEPIGPFNSQLDKEVLIDNDNWAVTLVDSFVNPAWNNPLMWGGHANIFIEKVENGVYSLHKAHLFSVDHNCSSRVELEVIAGFDPTRIASQTVTWVRSKENVQRMLDKVSDEIASQKDGDPSVHFNIRGKFTTLYRLERT